VTRFQLGNHLGSAVLEVDGGGMVISYEEYHPYGTTAYRAGTGAAQVSLKRYRYAGRERDEETGLYYLGARYLAPWLGRWTAADPAAMVDGTNLYAYVRGSPIRLMDPSGTQARTTYLGASNALADLARRQKVWGGNQYWSNDGPQGAGWYVKTEGNRILPGPAPQNQAPLPLPSGPGMDFLHWDPSKSLHPEGGVGADRVNREADVSLPPPGGVLLAGAALPAVETAAETAIEEAPVSGIRAIAPGPGSALGGVAAGAALLGAAVGGVIFFWDTNTKVKRWTWELNPKTGKPYTGQEEYEEVQRNPPETGSMRDRRKLPANEGPLVDPWKDDDKDAAPDAGTAPDAGDPCTAFPEVPKCGALGNFKYENKEGALKRAEELLGKGPYRQSPGGGNRPPDDPDFPPGAMHETYRTPRNDPFSIGSVECCEAVNGLPVIQKRWAFYK
jgi:RHS repeat-associated protein